MNETLKRAVSGTAYVIIMWFGASYSNFSCRLLFALLFIISFYEMWKLRQGRNKLLAFTYVLVPFILVQYIIQEDSSRDLILFIFILTWTFDSFAYLIGIRFGKNRILPSVSPKKSWEGFIGGSIFTIILAYFSYRYFNFENRKIPMIISILLPFTATIGDFIESYYKRKAGVKDSGKIIPGHGGILDRMDAFTITIPTVYLLIKLL